MNVQPLPPELARSAGPSFHPMTPRRAPEFPSATAAVGWNPCFACGQTGYRLMNCATYLQECARDPLRANRRPACNAVGLCPADCRRRLYVATSPYPHLELNKDGTSYFIRCGHPMPRWYRPKLLVGPARAAAHAVPTPAAPEYRTTYAVHSAALPIAATPALQTLRGLASGWGPTARGPTRCIQQLTWTPSVVVVEPDASERIMAMALHPPGPAAPASGFGDSAPGPQQPRPESVASNHLGSASTKGEADAGSLSATVAAEEGGSRDVRPPAAMQATSNPGRSVVLGSTRDAANVMAVRRDTEDTQQRSRPSGGDIEPTPRLPPPDFRPAHTRALASLDRSRCIAIIDTGADGSLVSPSMLHPDVKYLPWSKRDGRITGVAQQGIAILGHAVLEVQLGPVRALTPFVLALGVGFDAILGVDFLYEHGISVSLAQHCLAFEAHDGLIVPLVHRHPRFKHACALTHDVALYPGGRALVHFACERPGRRIGPPRAPEAYLIAARKSQKLGLVVPETLATGLIEIQSAADYPLYLPAGWEVAKVRDCHFVPHGPPRIVPRQQRVVVNVVSAAGAGESPAPPRGESLRSPAADTTPDPGGAGKQCLGRSGDLREDRTATGALSRDAPRTREMNSAERACTPDRETRPPRPRPVSLVPDRTCVLQGGQI